MMADTMWTMWYSILLASLGTIVYWKRRSIIIILYNYFVDFPANNNNYNVDNNTVDNNTIDNSSEEATTSYLLNKQSQDTDNNNNINNNNNNNNNIVNNNNNNNNLITLFNLSFGGVIILDIHYNIISVLDTAKDIVPNWKELKGTSFLELVTPEYQGAITQYLETNLQMAMPTPSSSIDVDIALLTQRQVLSQCPTSIVIHFRTYDRQAIPVEVKMTTLEYGPSNNVIVLALRDISKLSELTEVVNKIDQCRTNDAKVDLLSHISHELRNPISSIVASVQLLRATELSSLQREYLSLVDSSATSLLELIGQVLDIDKIGSGKMRLHNVDFNLTPLVEDVCAIVSTQALRKGVQVGSYIYTPCPLSVYGDPVRLRQILLNLLSNGVKFTKEGQVVVIVEPVSYTETSHTLRFEVRDSGIGIEHNKIQKLFKKYSQVHNGKMSEEMGGHGLGLVISKDLVDMMGGNMWCKSTPEGSSFFFTIKFEVPQKQLPCPVPNFNGLRVLVVDENEIIRSVICSYLKEWNCQTVECAEVSESVKELKARCDTKERIELVIVDVDNTTLKSFLKLKKTKEMEDYGKIGLIIMSKDRSVVHGIGVSNTAKLTKPIRQSHLVACILASMPDHPLVSPDIVSCNGRSTAQLPPHQPLWSSDSFSSVLNYHDQKDTSAVKNIATFNPLGDQLTASDVFTNVSADKVYRPPFRKITRRHSIDIIMFEGAPQSPADDPNGSTRHMTINEYPCVVDSIPFRGGLSETPDSSASPSDVGETSPKMPSGYISAMSSSISTTPATNKENESVLIVDDNEVCLKLTKRVVEAAGYPVCAVSRGSIALEEFDKHDYGIILMDCEMEDINGYKCTEIIRERETIRTVSSINSGKVPHVAIIAMTAYPEEDTDQMNKCFASGMDDYISKPYQIGHLHATLKKWQDRVLEQRAGMNERIQSMNMFPRVESDSDSSNGHSSDECEDDQAVAATTMPATNSMKITSSDAANQSILHPSSSSLLPTAAPTINNSSG
ncbi:hypothetical protein SAMD00019534_012260 [Acytostelium subglobosum LB1]|uniref:hypothetical protein n=1 Tax=Acytostelium subglobosum LB1 TaxID=1410327 RepID=UPI0006450A2D|nr:hypothetical protein SAMD00019534_012260 [Acytostelium subglobosum LB1]GAM18051.1 hypothetical protein SAMD00019534_012260 [Acytostelium subglobosum LB1]|eukprot:XP_012758647.1 hypothetical protein SAMD00019534_012260 [Acytostelium subglobosum LB1]